MDSWVVEVKLKEATGAQGLRRKVWGSIGGELGQVMGELLGTGMDALILNLEQVFQGKGK